MEDLGYFALMQSVVNASDSGDNGGMTAEGHSYYK
jgi:hypothetical protein